MFGVCEPEWLQTLELNVVEKGLEFRDFIETSKEMSQILKAEGCHYIVALTHMRLPNDRILAQEC